MSERAVIDVRRDAASGARSIHAEILGAARDDGLHFVALHGGPGFTGASLREGLLPLAAFAPVALIDLPGCGESSRHPGSGYPLGDYVDDVLAVVDALTTTRVVLVGHAWGAILAAASALADASRDTGRPAKRPANRSTNRSIVALVLVNPLRILNEHGQDEVAQARAMLATDPTLRPRFAALSPTFERARGGDPEAWDEIDRSAWPRDMLLTQFVGPPPRAWIDAMRSARLGYESYHAHKGTALYDEASEQARYDLAEIAARVTRPTLIVASASDANYVAPPDRHARPLRDAMPSATLIELDGLGHFPFVEAPERFADIVVSWLARVGVVEPVATVGG